jgi:hypothetical protein
MLGEVIHRKPIRPKFSDPTPVTFWKCNDAAPDVSVTAVANGTAQSAGPLQTDTFAPAVASPRRYVLRPKVPCDRSGFRRRPTHVLDAAPVAPRLARRAARGPCRPIRTPNASVACIGVDVEARIKAVREIAGVKTVDRLARCGAAAVFGVALAGCRARAGFRARIVDEQESSTLPLESATRSCKGGRARKRRVQWSERETGGFGWGAWGERPRSTQRTASDSPPSGPRLAARRPRAP